MNELTNDMKYCMFYEKEKCKILTCEKKGNICCGNCNEFNEKCLDCCDYFKGVKDEE